MDKLGIYDFFTVMIPGAVFIFLCSILDRELNIYSSLHFPSIIHSEFIKGLLLLIISLVCGSCIHVLSSFPYRHFENKILQKLLSTYKDWSAVYERVGNIVSRISDIQELLPFIAVQFEIVFKIKLDGNSLNKSQIGDMFDFIYYYLESKDRLDIVRSFQSYYLLYRNMTNLSFLFVFMLFLNAILLLFKGKHIPTYYINYFIGAIPCFIIFKNLAQWYRVEFVKKIFKIYFAVTEEEKNWKK